MSLYENRGNARVRVKVFNIFENALYVFSEYLASRVN